MPPAERPARTARPAGALLHRRRFVGRAVQRACRIPHGTDPVLWRRRGRNRAIRTPSLRGRPRSYSGTGNHFTLLIEAIYGERFAARDRVRRGPVEAPSAARLGHDRSPPRILPARDAEASRYSNICHARGQDARWLLYAIYDQFVRRSQAADAFGRGRWNAGACVRTRRSNAALAAEWLKVSSV